MKTHFKMRITAIFMAFAFMASLAPPFYEIAKAQTFAANAYINWSNSAVLAKVSGWNYTTTFTPTTANVGQVNTASASGAANLSIKQAGTNAETQAHVHSAPGGACYGTGTHAWVGVYYVQQSTDTVSWQCACGSYVYTTNKTWAYKNTIKYSCTYCGTVGDPSYTYICTDGSNNLHVTGANPTEAWKNCPSYLRSPSGSCTGSRLICAKTVDNVNVARTRTGTLSIAEKDLVYTSGAGTQASPYVLAITVANATVTAIAAQNYTGSQIKPNIATITVNGATLTKDTHYTLSYGANINAGTGTVTITGKSPYVGTKAVNFTINKKDLSTAAINTSDLEASVGSNLTLPAGKVTLGGTALVKGTEFTLQWKACTPTETNPLTQGTVLNADVLTGDYMVTNQQYF